MICLNQLFICYIHNRCLHPKSCAFQQCEKYDHAGSAELKIASAVAYKAASAFVPVLVGNYDLYARYPSSATTNVISRTGSSVVSLAGGKVYTLATEAISPLLQQPLLIARK